MFALRQRSCLLCVTTRRVLYFVSSRPCTVAVSLPRLVGFRTTPPAILQPLRACVPPRRQYSFLSHSNSETNRVLTSRSTELCVVYIFTSVHASEPRKGSLHTRAYQRHRFIEFITNTTTNLILLTSANTSPWFTSSEPDYSISVMNREVSANYWRHESMHCFKYFYIAIAIFLLA